MAEKVQAAVRTGPSKTEFREYPMPEIPEDSALMKVFGADGVGLFVGPSVVEREVCEQYGVQVVGVLNDIRERFYAVSVERRLKHPAVVSITDVARHRSVGGRRGGRSLLRLRPVRV